MTRPGRIRVGIGGWTYAPWRGTFYPAGLPQKRELEYASSRLTAIEINGTFYRSQSPESFAKWRDETPPDFMFSVKAPRYATHRKVLAEAGESIARFVDGGVQALGAKLGPLLWQFAPTKRFEPDDFERFLGLLPRADGLRHVLDVRHESFRCEAFLALARSHRVATVFTDSDRYPSFADPTGDFIYARLMRASASLPAGYAADALDRWAARAVQWSAGDEPGDLPRIAAPATRRAPREVFVFMIDGAKERAPAAAQALLSRLGSPTPR